MATPTAEALREDARRPDGRFGAQPHAESDLVLDAAPSSGVVPAGGTHPDDGVVTDDRGRVALHRPHRMPPEAVSYSSLSDLDYCAAKYAYERIDQAEPRDDAPVGPRLVGHATHEVVDRMSSAGREPDEVDTVVDQVVADDPELAEHADAIRKMATATVSWERTRPNRPRVKESERPVAGLIGNRRVPVTGFVDSLAEDDDGVLAVEDYKTGRPPREPADGIWPERKARQLAIYAELLETEGIHVSRGRLLYPGSKTVVEVDLDDEQGKWRRAAAHTFIQAGTRQMVSAYRTGNFPTSPSRRKCASCEFADRCPSGPKDDS